MIFLRGDRNSQKVQIYDVASENRIQSKNEPRGGFLYTARGLFFSVNFTAIFQFGGGTTTAPIGRRQTTVQKTKKEQKMG